MGFTIPRRQNFLSRFAHGFGQGLSQEVDRSLSEQREQSGVKNILDLLNQRPEEDLPVEAIGQLSGLKPETQRGVLSYIEQRKAQKEATKKQQLIQEDAAKAQALSKQYGFQIPEGTSLKDAISIYKQATKAPPGGVGAQPIPPELVQKAEDIIKNNPDATATDLTLKMDKAGIPRNVSNSLIESRRQEEDKNIKLSEQEQNRIEKRYQANKEFIDDTTNQYKSWEQETKPRLLQMNNLSDDELVSPFAAKLLDVFEIPLGSLENASNEVYDKLSNDLLKGLPDTFGSRILKVEVENFLKTIPTLLNSPNGKRLITANLLKLGEMKEAVYKQMRSMQKEYGETKPLPLDFQQSVFDNVLPQLIRLQNQFEKIGTIKPDTIPQGEVPIFSPQGTIGTVPKDQLDWYLQNGGSRIW